MKSGGLAKIKRKNKRITIDHGNKIVRLYEELLTGNPRCPKFKEKFKDWRLFN